MQATNSLPVSTLGFLDECHDLVLKHIRPQIKKMFESSDLAFMEFAEKAQSNASQVCFYEAMTVIQKNRANVENSFYNELGRSFADFGCAGPRATPAESAEDDDLTLISKEDTDIQVAIQNMVAGASTGSAQELFAMRQRLAVLNNGIQMEESDIPGGPTCLANAFHQAVSELVLEHQTLLIVYLLFNKFVLSKTTVLYDEYNKHLLKAGLLPNLKYRVRINPSRAQAQPQTGTAEEAGHGQTQAREQARGHAGTPPGESHYTDKGSDDNQTLGDELFGNIMQLLSRRNNPAHGHTTGNNGQQGAANSKQGQASGSNNAAQQGPAGTTPITQTEIVTALHQLQQTGTTANPVVTSTTGIVNTVRESNQLVATLVSNLSAEREQLYADVDRHSMPAADTQVIDLVGMMFEFIVKDDEIPSVAKVELSRLHTPYLKVAILDREFFTDYNHPAHELLNTLARAAARWVFENSLERGIFPAIHNVVECITADFESNIDLFSSLLEQFRTSVHDMENKSSAIEKRTQQAAEGKEKLRIARDYAAAAISECMKSHIVPDPIRKLLNDVWQEKLMFIYLREPDSSKSDSWLLAIETIKAIIWSVEPRTSVAAQTTLRERLPEVQQQIEMAGETLHAYGNNDNESQLALITSIQEAVLSASVDECRLPGQAGKQAPLDFRAPEAAARDSSNTESSNASQDADLPPELAAAMAELQDVAFGTWFLIQEEEDSLPERLKLSWYSSMSSNYMFVDCMGMKAGVRKHEELAALMVSGKARVLNTGQHPIIRRALEAIRRLLGSEKKAPE